jgi:SAM-dependent methyltransferase
MDTEISLTSDLKTISRVFDVDSLLKSKLAQGDIARYYQETRLAYRLIQSWDGFVHYAISYGTRHKSGDLEEQARIVNQYIKKTKANRVLELAYGMGANSAYLAKINPLISLDAIDHANQPLRKYKKIPNLKFKQGDYHYFAADKKYDLIFVVEALCHSADKGKVIEQVYRNLAPGGLFIIFDGYSRRNDSELSTGELEMKRLCEVGMALPKLETPQDLEKYCRYRFRLIKKTDFSENILPNAKYFNRLARIYFYFPALARIMNRFLSFEVARNALPALLTYDSVRLGVGCYYMHVFEKK